MRPRLQVELNLSEFHLNAISVRFFPRLGVLARLISDYIRFFAKGTLHQDLDGDLRDDVDGVGDQLEMRGLLDGVFAVGLLAAISSFHFRENLGYPQRTGHWAATTQNEGMNHTND